MVDETMLPQGQQEVQPLFSQQMGQQMSAEDQKASLDEIMNRVDEKMRGVNAKKFVVDNQAEQGRVEALKEVLNEMEQAGVDLNDQQSINEFMSNLEEESPDLYELFTGAMESLLGQEQKTEILPANPGDLTSLSKLSNAPSVPDNQEPQVQSPADLGNLSAMIQQ